MKTKKIDITNPKCYFNRELSLIEFNKRVLEEAKLTSHPLLERIKFCTIFSSNLDEFFIIRFSGTSDKLSC
jgi:polyphosphate kinase